MDGRGGCCIARYSGGDGGGTRISYGMSKVDRIMLKFRPIAPKPMAAGSGSSGSTMENSDGYGGTKRRKRKYVTVNGNKNKKDATTVSKKRNVSASSPSVSGGGDAVVTLSLMPETPERKEKSPVRSSASEIPDLLHSVPKVNLNRSSPISGDGQVRGTVGHVISVEDHAVLLASRSPPQQRLQVLSFVTMECVTDTAWENGNGLGFITDKARVMNMEMDTCPSFITNSQDTVVWTNKAYREMTAGGVSEETVVMVVKKHNMVTMPVCHAAFTCKVKVSWGSERTSPATLTAPCDVWRLQSGGYAWRLDVKAALCLGR